MIGNRCSWFLDSFPEGQRQPASVYQTLLCVNAVRNVPVQEHLLLGDGQHVNILLYSLGCYLLLGGNEGNIFNPVDIVIQPYIPLSLTMSISNLGHEQ